MSSPRITITYSADSAATVVDPFWVRLEQDALEDDTATVSDAASLLDAAYQIEPCDQVEDTDAVEPDEESFAAAVTEAIDFAACDYSSNGDIDIQIKVIRSHRSEPYRLRLQGGELVSTETITKTITISNKVEAATSLTLDWPVIADFTSAWTAGGGAEVTRVGNTLTFAEAADGVLSASYLTEYDLVTITVLGVDGKPGACTARVFFHGLVDEMDCELPTPEEFDQSAYCHPKWVGPPPDTVVCYQTVRVHKLCSCSDVEWDVEEYDQVVECPEDDLRCANNATDCMFFLGTVSVDEYVECPEDKTGTFDSDLRVPEFYLAKCCEQPSVRLPQCSTKKLSWRGGAGIIHGAQHYIDLYGPTTRIVPLMPDGGICGTWTVEQKIMGSNCCDGVAPLSWDYSANADVVAPNSNVLVEVNGGGKYPCVWQVSGKGFWLDAGRSVKRAVYNGRLATIYTDSDACGSVLITASDGCSTTTGSLRCTIGAWVVLWSGYPDSIGDPSADGFFLCSRTGYMFARGEGFVQGRYWVGAYSADPPEIRARQYFRESHVYGVWAHKTDVEWVVIIPGTEAEPVRISALAMGAYTTCSDGSGPYNLMWYAEKTKVCEWIC